LSHESLDPPLTDAEFLLWMVTEVVDHYYGKAQFNFPVNINKLNTTPKSSHITLLVWGSLKFIQKQTERAWSIASELFLVTSLHWFVFVASKPTMSMLKTMTTRNGKKLDAMLILSQDWQQVGDLLDFDDMDITTSNIRMTRSLQGNAACLKEVLQLWLSGKRRNTRYVPLTWESFVNLLMDLRHTTLASDLTWFF